MRIPVVLNLGLLGNQKRQSLRVGGEADIVRIPVVLNPGLLGNQKRQSLLRSQDVLHHITINIGEPNVAALVAVSEPLVV